jgi:hypothetical protein
MQGKEKYDPEPQCHALMVFFVKQIEETPQCKIYE